MLNHVKPDGDELKIVDTERLQVFKTSVGSMDNNAYLLVPADAPCLLIDAAANPKRLLEFVAGRDLSCVVTTHRHADHIGALTELIEATQANAIAGQPDAEAIGAATGVAQQPAWTGDQIAVGDYALDVIGLVGHTPGSIALVLELPDEPVHIFTGDSLFPGGVGKTNTPADFESLFHDVSTQIFDRFADDTVIHPGHGDDTTLGTERGQLAEWKARGW